jgi:hypothetical protein
MQLRVVIGLAFAAGLLCSAAMESSNDTPIKSDDVETSMLLSPTETERPPITPAAPEHARH